MTPVSRADATSHLAFSMNQPARRKATGIVNVLKCCSMMWRRLSRLGSVAWAPMVERQTTFGGRARFDGGENGGVQLL